MKDGPNSPPKTHIRPVSLLDPILEFHAMSSRVTGTSMRLVLALTALLLSTVQVMGQFSNVQVPPSFGVSGGVSGVALPQFAAPTTHPIKEALAEAIVLNAETKKNKHAGNQNAAPNSVPAAKTKNFAYTQISVPTSTPQE